MSRTNDGIKIDKIFRSRRKTISLEVKADGRLIVRAPHLSTRRQINQLVQSKSNWIRSKQELVKSQSQEVPHKYFVAGEQYQFLGKSYYLELVDAQAEPLVLIDKFYLSAKVQIQGKRVFENWYKKRASEIIKELVSMRAQQNGYEFTNIRITSAKTRWGSCGPKGSLNFTWRLVMAPRRVIDYVVVHELVHLEIKNHSRSYWDQVRKVMPEYDQYRKWLKKNGHRLTLD